MESWFWKRRRSCWGLRTSRGADADQQEFRARTDPVSVLLDPATDRIDGLHSREVCIVVGYHEAIVGFGDGSYDHVEGAPWPSRSRPLGHQASPDEAGAVVKR